MWINDDDFLVTDNNAHKCHWASNRAYLYVRMAGWAEPLYIVPHTATPRSAYLVIVKGASTYTRI